MSRRGRSGRLGREQLRHECLDARAELLLRLLLGRRRRRLVALQLRGKLGARGTLALEALRHVLHHAGQLLAQARLLSGDLPLLRRQVPLLRREVLVRGAERGLLFGQRTVLRGELLVLRGEGDALL